MATRTPVLLGTSWTLIYNTTASGDFSGIIQQVGGAGDAIIHISTSAPPAGDAGIVVDGGLPVNLTQSSGLKIYGRSNSGAAVVIMTTNIGPMAGAVTPGTPVPDGVIASDGVLLPVDSLAQTLAYTGSILTTVTVSYGGSTYIQTLTYTGVNLTGVSQWVKQ